MKLWRRLGVDELMRSAARRGTVLCGVSAGAICWFAHGHSDSRRYGGGANWEHIRVRGLGIVPGLFCPHYHAESREADLARMTARTGDRAIACDNDSAFIVEGSRYRVAPALPRASVCLVSRDTGAAGPRRLPSDGVLRPLAELGL
jgi:dipeptidase E